MDPDLTATRLRAFTRFYTRLVGALDEVHLKSGLPLPQVRLLWEVGEQPQTATDLAVSLGLNKGYLSRLISALGEQGLISRQSGAGTRGQMLTLTHAGADLRDQLIRDSQAQAHGLLAPLPPSSRRHLSAAAATLRLGLGDATPPAAVIRSLNPGDIGTVIAAHGRLYAQEYGWDGTFEALVARICADFLEATDQTRQWAGIVDVDGAVMGSSFVVDGGDGAAKLRLVYVDPLLRGQGVAAQMLEQALTFAQGAGYDRMVLWTQSCLTAARRMYARAGFIKTGDSAHHSFGVDLIGETWERPL